MTTLCGALMARLCVRYVILAADVIFTWKEECLNRLVTNFSPSTLEAGQNQTINEIRIDDSADTNLAGSVLSILKLANFPNRTLLHSFPACDVDNQKSS